MHAHTHPHAHTHKSCVKFMRKVKNNNKKTKQTKNNKNDAQKVFDKNINSLRKYRIKLAFLSLYMNYFSPGSFFKSQFSF